MTPLPAGQALDQFFLDARCRLLDLAAILDRIDRGDGSVSADPRLAKLVAGVELLRAGAADRAERIQRLFSQEYDATWTPPRPRY
jgi:hypothetical protein